MGISIYMEANNEAETIVVAGQNEISDLRVPII
jgi:hypothetical protein